MTKKRDVLAKLRESREPKKLSPWFRNQTPECQEALIQFRDEYRQGGWRDRPLSEIIRAFRKEFSLTGYENGLKNFLAEGADHEEAS